jgi:hypothetical protein
MVLIGAIFIFLTPMFKDDDSGEFPFYYYIIFFILNTVSSIFSFIVYISIGSFFAQIADKEVGSTYMTFLSFWASIGSSWSRTFALFLVDAFTYKYCFIPPLTGFHSYNTNVTFMSALKKSNHTSDYALQSIRTNTCSNDAKISVIFSLLYIQSF